MKQWQRIIMICICMGQGSIVFSQSCVDLVPDKRDYIVSAQMLRQAIQCLEDKIPKPVAMPNNIQPAIHFDDQTYIVPLNGQTEITIRQLDRFEQTYTYQITFFDRTGKKIKNISLEFKNKQTEQIDLAREKINNANYAIVKIAVSLDQKEPMTIISAS